MIYIPVGANDIKIRHGKSQWWFEGVIEPPDEFDQFAIWFDRAMALSIWDRRWTGQTDADFLLAVENERFCIILTNLLLQAPDQPARMMLQVVESTDEEMVE